MELIKYDANHHITSTLSANYAKQFIEDDRWEAKNNVIATNAQGDTLKTEHLIWDEKAEKIHTEEFVKIIRENQIITGIGFVSDPSIQNWKILKPQGSIYVEVNTDSQNIEENGTMENQPEKQ